MTRNIQITLLTLSLSTSRPAAILYLSILTGIDGLHCQFTNNVRQGINDRKFVAALTFYSIGVEISRFLSKFVFRGCILDSLRNGKTKFIYN